MPRKPSLRWNEAQLRWYHGRDGFSREHWWIEATQKPESELARLLYTGKKRGRTLVPLLEPLIWETARRHPGLEEVWRTFETNPSPQERQRRRAQYGELSYLVNALYRCGDKDWASLKDDVRSRIGENIRKNAQTLGYAVGAYVKDVFTDNLKFQLLDNANDGAEFPEQRRIIDLLNDAHARGNRILVLEVDPHSNETDLSREVAQIFGQSYASNAKPSVGYIEKLRILGIKLPPKKGRTVYQFRSNHLDEICHLDSSEKLSRPKRRQYCLMFKKLRLFE